MAEDEVDDWFSSRNESLINLIRKAFAGVRLGNGIGLYESQGLDDRESATTCALYRARDEKDDWSRLTEEDLNFCESSLSFCDSEGMRFHLPAYLILHLRGLFNGDIVITLTSRDHYNQFSLLSLEQRDVVRAFLLNEIDREAAELGDFDLNRSRIRRSLGEYWTIEGTRPST